MCSITRKCLCESHNGLSLMNSIIDVTLFNTQHSPPPSESSFNEAPLCDTVVILPHPVSDDSMNVLCEALKIIFNQTVHLTDDAKHTKVTSSRLLYSSKYSWYNNFVKTCF